MCPANERHSHVRMLSQYRGIHDFVATLAMPV